MLRETRFQRGIFEIVFYVFIVGGIVSLATFSGFALGGFKESFFANLIEISSYLGSYLIYIPLLFVSIVLVIFPIMNGIYIKKGEHPATQKNLGWLRRILTVSYLYNPEQSFLWYLANKFKEKKAIKWSTNIMRVVFLSVLVFLALGILIVLVPQLAISGVPQTPQQITATSDIIFGAGIPSVAENGTLLFTYFSFLGIVALLCHLIVYKRTRNKDLTLLVFFLIGVFFIAPLMGYIWGEYHSIVYGNSEASLWATRIFGGLGAELIIFTGIFLWWLMWHFFNNLVLKLLETTTLGSDVAIYLGIVWFLILIVYIFVEITLFKKRRKNRGLALTS